ncbi:M15 family metallopeptidase [Paraneptunicella aestuarii]|uniref:M15 family metallopeptidase n=1 Tax=Paraneptunicella aestuarii TaxID=2831148 RepID=UPI001E33CDBB|nr:M15 family metallopeptidase [Paraneptunicella aestuarii]UAA37264.1 M15 family metallopeptidase [Paraneptunicella aestuarii]
MLTPDNLTIIDEKHRLHPEAYKRFLTMREVALSSGVHIDIVSSYRSVEQQLAIWNAKWRGERPLYNRKTELVDAHTLSNEEKLHTILIFSALPGASRHHWGTDLDVYDATAMSNANQTLQLIEAEYAPGAPCYPLFQWMQHHSHEFGFYFPYIDDVGGIAREPWHISFKPIADKILAELTLEKLQQQIEKMDILGKSTILENLPDIYHRYILNKGVI